MATFKTVNTDYTLTCDNGNGVFTVNAQTIFNGNVVYTVPAVTVSPFLTVASNNTGNITDMGLLAQLGPTTFAGLRFDVASNVWQVSSSVDGNGAPIASYANLVTGSGSTPAAGANTQIQFNQGNAFAASANLTFDVATQRLTLKGHEAFGNIGLTPAPVANSAVLYNKAVGGGGTGMYVVSASVDDELVSKSKAIVYSIIF